MPPRKDSPPASRLHERFREVSRSAAVAVIALGAAVLVGWAAGIERLVRFPPSSRMTMKANTAVSFVLMGSGLYLIQRGNGRELLRRALALVIVSIAAVTGVEYAFGIDLGIDQLLFRDVYSTIGAPGRMSVETALNFTLLGLALFLWRRDVQPSKIARAAVVVATLVAFAAVIGYVFGAVSLYKVAPLTSIAFHTALGSLVACVAFLTVDPDRGFASIAAAATPAGLLIRRLLPALVLGPILIGWLRLVGEEHGLQDVRLGMAVVTVGDVLLLSTVLFLTAARLHRSDEALRANEERFRLMVDAIHDYAIFMLDVEGRVAHWNAGAERLLGFTSPEVLGSHRSILLPPEQSGETSTRDELLEIAAREGRFEVEAYRMRSDGTPFFASIVISPIRAAGGALLG